MAVQVRILYLCQIKVIVNQVILFRKMLICILLSLNRSKGGHQKSREKGVRLWTYIRTGNIEWVGLDLAKELKEKGAEYEIMLGNRFTGHRSI